MMPESRALTLAGAAGWAAGSQIPSGYMPALVPNAMKNTSRSRCKPSGLDGYRLAISGGSASKAKEPLRLDKSMTATINPADVRCVMKK
ncbi:MAG: hypothetical protein BWY83_03427 [bacterium ADurb.Bin478]|nr:MAG: hypothetical protein BWY83_03427 [bacterium ADurb.Bin478]